MRTLAIVAGAVCLLSLAGLVALARPRGTPEALRPDPGVVGLSMPEFSMVDQDGRAFTRADLLGRVTIVDFIFTHCPFACPRLTGHMLTMTRELRGTGVRFASITVDPAHDTPEVLRAYATQRGCDLTRWSFLHGPAEQVHHIARERLKFELAEDTGTPITLPDGTTMNNIVHPTHFVLLGPQAQVLGVFRSSDEQAVFGLIARARAADAALR